MKNELSSKEYEMFMLLPEHEKIHYLYDQYFDDREDSEKAKSHFNKMRAIESLRKDTMGELYYNIFHKLFNYNRFGIFFENNFIIVNSDKKKLIQKIKFRMMEDGFIFKMDLSKREKVGHSGGFKYLAVFEMIDICLPLSLS